MRDFPSHWFAMAPAWLRPSGPTHWVVSQAHSTMHLQRSRLASSVVHVSPTKMPTHGRSCSRAFLLPTMSTHNSATDSLPMWFSVSRAQQSTRSALLAAPFCCSVPMSRKNFLFCSSVFVTPLSKIASPSSRFRLVRAVLRRLLLRRCILAQAKPPMSSLRSWARQSSIEKSLVFLLKNLSRLVPLFLHRPARSLLCLVVHRSPNRQASRSLRPPQFSMLVPTPRSSRHCVDQTFAVRSTWALLRDSFPVASPSKMVPSGTPRSGQQCRVQPVSTQKAFSEQPPTAASMSLFFWAPIRFLTSPMPISLSVVSRVHVRCWRLIPHSILQVGAPMLCLLLQALPKRQAQPRTSKAA